MVSGPKNKKFRKDARGKIKGNATRNCFVSFGQYVLRIDESFRITEKQIDTIKLTISRILKKTGRLWIRCFADVAVTSKSLGVRMGGGKGGLDHYIARVKRGQILFELGDGVSELNAFKALELAASKMPVACTIVRYDDYISPKLIQQERALEVK